MRLRDAILAAALATLIAGAIGAQQPWTDDPAVAGATPIKAVQLEEIHWRIGAPRQDRGVPRAIDTDPPRSDNAIQASHFVHAVSAPAGVYRSDAVEPPAYERIAVAEPIHALTINALGAAITDRERREAALPRGPEFRHLCEADVVTKGSFAEDLLNLMPADVPVRVGRRRAADVQLEHGKRPRPSRAPVRAIVSSTISNQGGPEPYHVPDHRRDGLLPRDLVGVDPSARRPADRPLKAPETELTVPAEGEEGHHEAHDCYDLVRAAVPCDTRGA